jgi:rhamnogalacturonan endolyase
VLGDWREEIITSVEGELRIYTTTIPATDRHVCLMQDPLYRLDVAHLAMAYAQPPMTSFYLDEKSEVKR